MGTVSANSAMLCPSRPGRGSRGFGARPGTPARGVSGVVAIDCSVFAGDLSRHLAIGSNLQQPFVLPRLNYRPGRAVESVGGGPERANAPVRNPWPVARPGGGP